MNEVIRTIKAYLYAIGVILIAIGNVVECIGIWTAILDIKMFGTFFAAVGTFVVCVPFIISFATWYVLTKERAA